MSQSCMRAARRNANQQKGDESVMIALNLFLFSCYKEGETVKCKSIQYNKHNTECKFFYLILSMFALEFPV